LTTPPQYRSDRWVTPGVVITGLVGAVLLVALTIGAVTYLQSIGRDPEPMLKLAGLAVTGAASVGNFLLTLASRRTMAKVERNTGVQANATDALAGAVYEVADALPRPVARHATTDTVLDMRAAPAPRGE
jgi:hypothetical protein